MSPDYFHIYPTCPNCHEPHKSGAILSYTDGTRDTVYCNACGAIFSSKVDFSNFPNTSHYLLDGGEEEYLINKIPLIWKFNPNIIEKSYLDWIKNGINGKYLITWPWKEVRFVPILISEYILRNPSKKIIFIGEINDPEQFNEDYIVYPEMNIIFDYLLHINTYENKLPSELRTERNRFRERDVLKKKERIHFWMKIIRNQYGEDDSEDNFYINTEYSGYTDDLNFNTCSYKLKRFINSKYGEGAVRKIRKKEFYEWNYNTINREGFMDICIDKVFQWTGKLDYDKFSYWNVLANYKNLKRVKRVLSSLSIFSDFNLESLNENNVIYVSKNIPFESISELINTYNPDIIILTNVDDYIDDKKVHRGENGRNFFNFIEQTKKNIIMFSIKPDSRHLYEINDGENSSKSAITLHTWDSNVIIEKLFDINSDMGEISPISSSLAELSQEEKPLCEYIRIDGLELIEEKFPEIIKYNQNSFIVKKYLQDLIRSPLFIYGNYTKSEFFRRGEWQYDIIMETIMEKNYEVFNNVKDVFEEVYSITTEQKNPIMDKIIIILKELIKNKSAVVFIIVHPLDINGTKKLLLEHFKEEIPKKIKVIAWSELEGISLEYDKNSDLFVVSTIRPYIEYKLYSSKIKKFFILGSENNIENLKLIFEDRISEMRAKPVHILSENEDAPKILKNLMRGIEKPEKINELISTIKFEENVNLPWEKDIKQFNNAMKHQIRTLHTDDEAVLVVNEEGVGMFLPLDKIISLKIEDKYTIEDIKVDKSKFNDLKGKEIVINNEGFYASFKLIFTKFMVEMGKNVIIKDETSKWTGFDELIKSSSEWIRVLQIAIKKMSEEHNISRDEARECLSEYIAGLGLNARDKSYIKFHWLAEPQIISTSIGEVEIFEIEHPKAFSDVLKLYDGINELFPSMNLNMNQADNTYSAALILQGIRRKFLKGNKEAIALEHRYIYGKLQEEIRKIIQKSKKFKINTVFLVKLCKPVYPFRTIENYEDYTKG